MSVGGLVTRSYYWIGIGYVRWACEENNNNNNPQVHSLLWLNKQPRWPSTVGYLASHCSGPVCVIILCELSVRSKNENDLFGSRWVRMGASWGIPWLLVELCSTSSFVELTKTTKWVVWFLGCPYYWYWMIGWMQAYQACQPLKN